jgi:taurine dioxygenase
MMEELAMSLTITPTGETLGASVQGANLSKPLGRDEMATVLRALGRHGVLRFPHQRISAEQLRDFSAGFGEIQYSVGGNFSEPGVPEVGILSNIRVNGKPIGFADAGQDWHTDMSYNQTKGFVNVLYALHVPRRDGQPLGGTLFANMHEAYKRLEPALRARLQDMTVTHDFNKYWDEARRVPGSTRPPLTPEQKAKRPPATHPVFLTHPLTGAKVLYCNPGYATRINQLNEAESDRVLQLLFAHQLRPEFQYTHVWSEGDVLIWDNIGTLHKAKADYQADEHRLMRRCQVMANKVFDPAFLGQYGFRQAAE